MGQLTRRANQQIERRGGKAHWAVMLIGAVSIVFLWDPYQDWGKGHHYFAVMVVFIATVLVAALTEKRHRS